MSEPSWWERMVWRIFWNCFISEMQTVQPKTDPGIPWCTSLVYLVGLSSFPESTETFFSPALSTQNLLFHSPLEMFQNWNQEAKRPVLFHYIPLVPGRFTGITVSSVKRTSLQGLLSWNIWRECNTLPCLKIKRCGINHSEFLFNLILLFNALGSPHFTKEWYESMHLPRQDHWT